MAISTEFAPDSICSICGETFLDENGLRHADESTGHPFMRTIAPVVNMNGTDVDSLLDQRRAIYDALTSAVEAMLAAFPHGRDYQTAPAGTYEAARAQAERRLKTVQTLIAEILNEVAALYEQKHDR